MSDYFCPVKRNDGTGEVCGWRMGDRCPIHEPDRCGKCGDPTPGIALCKRCEQVNEGKG